MDPLQVTLNLSHLRLLLPTLGVLPQLGLTGESGLLGGLRGEGDSGEVGAARDARHWDRKVTLHIVTYC